MEMRMRLVQYMQEHKEHYLPFLQDSSWDSYMQKLGDEGVWGGDTEIHAMAQLLGAKFEIWSANSENTPLMLVEPEATLMQETKSATNLATEVVLWSDGTSHYNTLY